MLLLGISERSPLGQVAPGILNVPQRFAPAGSVLILNAPSVKKSTWEIAFPSHQVIEVAARLGRSAATIESVSALDLLAKPVGLVMTGVWMAVSVSV